MQQIREILVTGVGVLILRSIAERCVSKDRRDAMVREARLSRAPHHEALRDGRNDGGQR
jgi:hypothetical protein